MSGDSLGIGDATPSSIPLEAGNARDVFISYASQDAAVANAIVESLERHGVRCWIAPRDVVPGSLYADEIVGAINDAKVVVLVLSEHSVASPHVGKEVERASSKHRRIIAFHVDSAPLTRAYEYFLSESQWINVGVGGMEAAAGKLAEAVRRHLAPESRGHSDPSDLNPNTKAPRGRWMVIGGGAVLAAAVAYLVVDKFWMSRHIAAQKPIAAAATETVPAAPAIPEKSVAVLPFVDMSEGKDQEYFSDGLSEELIDMLTKVPDLRVPARTSSFYFKGKQTKIIDIAKELGVAHVLEGSVRKSGKTLRITAQLIRADNGYHLWSETYDRTLDDIFKMQDEIAVAVVKALKVSLLEGAVPQSLAKSNTVAYTLYLQGRAMIRRASSKAEWENAVDYFQRAVSADPTFATAWAWLAYARCDEMSLGFVDRQVVSVEARRAADRAFALNSNLADAHGAIGMINYHFDWNWEAAAAEFKKAHELDPADAGAAKVLADALWQLGGDDKTTMGLYQQAIDLDPVDDLYFFTLSGYHLYMGRLPEAEATARKALDLNPRGWGIHAQLGTVMLARGESTQALAEFQREPDESARRAGVALAQHALGRKEEADAALTEAERKDAATGAYEIAEIYAYRGEIDHAFAWLDRAYRQRDAGLTATNRDPLLNNLKSDPRYKAFLRKMKLPE